MITPTLLNQKDNSLTRSGLAISDSLAPSVVPPAKQARARSREYQESNKVLLPVEHSHYSDEELLQLIAQRDANALSEIYDRHAQMVYNLIVRIVREPAIAEDLLQETFWQVWQKAESFSGSRFHIITILGA